MKLHLAALLSLLTISSAGCDRSDGKAEQERPAAASLAATKAAEAAVQPAVAQARPAEAAEKMSCGNAEMAEGTCAGEKGEAGGCSQWDEAATKVAKRATPADAVWATIPVQGMTCGGCERRVIANLGEVEGILGVEADAELGQVRIAHARGNEKMSGDARAHIKALGYKPQ